MKVYIPRTYRTKRPQICPRLTSYLAVPSNTRFESPRISAIITSVWIKKSKRSYKTRHCGVQNPPTSASRYQPHHLHWFSCDGDNGFGDLTDSTIKTLLGKRVVLKFSRTGFTWVCNGASSSAAKKYISRSSRPEFVRCLTVSVI